MMLTTHALVGAFLAVPVAVIAPSLAPVAFLAGILGGAFPDLDILAHHRKTLHYPRYYTFVAFTLVVVAVFHTTAVTAALAVFTGAAALHSLMDALGGGAEARPWERSTEHAVYDHYSGGWIAPRRWVRYDGAPEDLALIVLVAVPVTYVAPRPFIYVIGVFLFVSLVYTGFRRAVVPAFERVASVSLGTSHEATEAAFEDKDGSDKTL